MACKHGTQLSRDRSILPLLRRRRWSAWARRSEIEDQERSTGELQAPCPLEAGVEGTLRQAAAVHGQAGSGDVSLVPKVFQEVTGTALAKHGNRRSCTGGRVTSLHVSTETAKQRYVPHGIGAACQYGPTWPTAPVCP